LVSILHESMAVELIAEREIPTAVTAQGYSIHSDRIVYLGTGKTRSAYRWRLIDATDTQGQRRTIVSSLLEESAERLTQLRAYRWTIEIVFRWLKRVLQLDTLISYSPGGIQLQVAVALITYGVLLLYHAGGALSVKALQQRVQRALHEALFAAGVAEGERRAQERTRRAAAGVPLLRATG
jgi:Transposase DDE domain